MGGVFDHYSHKLHTSPLNLFDVFVNVSFFFLFFFFVLLNLKVLHLMTHVHVVLHASLT